MVGQKGLYRIYAAAEQGVAVAADAAHRRRAESCRSGDVLLGQGTQAAAMEKIVALLLQYVLYDRKNRLAAVGQGRLQIQKLPLGLADKVLRRFIAVLAISRIQIVAEKYVRQIFQGTHRQMTFFIAEDFYISPHEFRPFVGRRSRLKGQLLQKAANSPQPFRRQTHLFLQPLPMAADEIVVMVQQQFFRPFWRVLPAARLNQQSFLYRPRADTRRVEGLDQMQPLFHIGDRQAVIDADVFQRSGKKAFLIEGLDDQKLRKIMEVVDERKR